MATNRKTARSKAPKKNTKRLTERFSLDFAAVRRVQLRRSGIDVAMAGPVARGAGDDNPALMRLQALAERDAPHAGLGLPVNASMANWKMPCRCNIWLIRSHSSVLQWRGSTRSPPPAWMPGRR